MPVVEVTGSDATPCIMITLLDWFRARSQVSTICAGAPSLRGRPSSSCTAGKGRPCLLFLFMAGYSCRMAACILVEWGRSMVYLSSSAFSAIQLALSKAAPQRLKVRDKSRANFSCPCRYDALLRTVLFVECVLEESRDNFSVFNLHPPQGRENAHATATNLARRNIADRNIDVWMGSGKDRGLGFSPIGFLVQSKPFNAPNTYVRKLILVIRKGSKACDIPRTNVEIGGARLCIYGQPPLDSESPQPGP